MSVLVLMFLGCSSLIFFCLHISGVVGFSWQDLETSRRFVVGFSGGYSASSSGGGVCVGSACDRFFFFFFVRLKSERRV